MAITEVIKETGSYKRTGTTYLNTYKQIQLCVSLSTGDVTEYEYITWIAQTMYSKQIQTQM